MGGKLFVICFEVGKKLKMAMWSDLSIREMVIMIDVCTINVVSCPRRLLRRGLARLSQCLTTVSCLRLANNDKNGFENDVSVAPPQ